MDPDVVLMEIRRLAAKTEAISTSRDTELITLAIEMAVRFEALDEWMTKGRYPPADWGPHVALWREV